MGFFDLFRRSPAIVEAGALAEFIDRNAAFLVQKGMYEYSRARAGHYAKVLLREPEFLIAMESARWQAYPLGLAMVGEMVEKVLNPHIAADRRAGIDALAGLVLSVFDRYPIPEPFDAPTWEGERRELARQLELIGLHPPKPVKDIPVPFAKRYFDLMPIHQKLRAPDYPSITNYLRVSLINIHDRLVDCLDGAAAAQSLLAGNADRRRAPDR
ncbi:hypothetical protein [Bradyrhizobium sp.]|uniref:hypothetical protein n=1 Tax=Bradyrhizobium sp. TaxID=376 RepID=UPI0025BA48E0|nr:hypothetical protein [Bradyrhizobium sp.]